MSRGAGDGGRERLASLDVFRGATVALMVLVNNPGSFSHVYPPLEHAAWHGWTPTDLVFPFFLYAVGHALAWVMPGYEQAPPARFWRRLLVRTAAIFGIGLLINAAPFVRWDADGQLVWRDLGQLRIMGVLQRIALAWGAAAIVARIGGVRAAVAAAAALLLGYWWACVALGDPADPYGLHGWFGTAVDRALLGERHLYRGEGVPFDPEGLASTAPAVAQVLIGYVVGSWMRGAGLAGSAPAGGGRGGDAAALRRRVIRIGLVALALGAAAAAWSTLMPINKKLWTSSYVLATSALAVAALAALVWRLDGAGGALPWWARAAAAFGRNALLLYAASSLLPRLLGLLRWSDGVGGDGRPRLTTPLPWLYQRWFEGLGDDPRLGSLLLAAAQLACWWLLAVWLDRRRLHVRL